MSSHPTILVVDDNIDIRDAIAFLLEQEGMEVLSAAHGREALDILHSSPPPAMILLDLMMPEMNGWDFLSFKGADPLLAAIPVVVMTAAPQSAPRNVKVLQKPALARTIVDAVKCCCSQKLHGH